MSSRPLLLTVAFSSRALRRASSTRLSMSCTPGSTDSLQASLQPQDKTNRAGPSMPGSRAGHTASMTGMHCSRSCLHARLS